MIFFDAHVHIYPEYDLDALLTAFAGRARSVAPAGSGLAMAVLLRSFQRDLASLLALPAGSRWRVEEQGGGDTAAVVTDGDVRIALFPARQVAARERVELLGFFGDAPVPDGLPLAETADRLRAAGYLPVIAWGRGKWLFKRGRLVAGLMADETRREPRPLVGDSALRPPFWPEPLFRLAGRLGLRLTYGSDPLPGAGNARRAGMYATLVDAAPTPSCAALLRALREAPMRPCGHRALI